MSGPRYRSAWGDDVDNLPAEVSRAEEPIHPPVIIGYECPVCKDGVYEQPGQLVETGKSFSAALAAALTPYGPPHSKWGVLAKRIGVHASLLRRMRLGQGGVTAKTMDKIAERLGWSVTISHGE